MRLHTRRRLSRTQLALTVACSAALVPSTPLVAQTAGCAVAEHTVQAASAAVYRLSAPCLAALRTALAAGEFGRALRIYFGESYNPNLVNWVVYVRADGSVSQGVIQNDRVTELLRGQKYVYTSAFFEAVPTNPRDTVNPALELSRRSINFQKEQFTAMLVNAFGGGKVPAFDNGATIADLDRAVSLRLVSDDPAMPLWAGSARVEIGENTDVQLALAAPGRQRLPGTLSRLYTTFNNAKATRWDVGLGFGAAFGAGAVTSVTTVAGTTQTVAPSIKTNLYLTTYLNLLPARLPRFRRSWGLVGGANLTKGALLDDILTGVSVGRLVGDAGLITGVLWEMRRTESKDPVTNLSRTTESRVPRFFFGFDLRA